MNFQDVYEDLMLDLLAEGLDEVKKSVESQAQNLMATLDQIEEIKTSSGTYYLFLLNTQNAYYTIGIQREGKDAFDEDQQRTKFPNTVSPHAIKKGLPKIIGIIKDWKKHVGGKPLYVGTANSKRIDAYRRLLTDAFEMGETQHSQGHHYFEIEEEK